MNFTRLGFLATSSLVLLWCATASAALTGQYLFEGNHNDTSGFNRHGTLSGGATFTTGLYSGSSQAILMNGASTIQLPPSTNFITNAPGATLTAWIRPDALPTGNVNTNIVVVNNADTASGGGIGAARALLEYNGNQGIRAIGRRNDSGGSTTVTSGNGAISVGNTYFLAGVFDYTNGDLILYINGSPVASNLNVTGWTGSSANSANLVARIGSNAAGADQFWNGAIDGVRIFDSVLTAEQIMGLYTSPDTIPNPVVLGDTDGDTIVELSDLDPIRQNYMQNVAARNMGDLVDDNIVDFQDFRQWKTAWLEANAGSGGLAGVDLSFLSAGPVPEPSTACLFVLGILAVAGGRQKRNA